MVLRCALSFNFLLTVLGVLQSSGIILHSTPVTHHFQLPLLLSEVAVQPVACNALTADVPQQLLITCADCMLGRLRQCSSISSALAVRVAWLQL